MSKKTTKWAVSFHEGIRVEIKPKFVNALEIFIKVSSLDENDLSDRVLMALEKRYYILQ